MQQPRLPQTGTAIGGERLIGRTKTQQRLTNRPRTAGTPMEAPPGAPPTVCNIGMININTGPVLGAPPAPVGPETKRTIDQQEKQKILAQAQQLRETLPPLTIEFSQVTLFSYEELKSIAVAEITSSEPEGKFTINDPRLGVTENNQKCGKCHGTNLECPGHLGIIELAELTYHPSYMREVIRVLSCVCNSCGNLLLTRKELKDRGINRYKGKARLELIESACENLDPNMAVCRKRHPPGTKACTPNPKYLPARIKDTGQIMYKTYAQRGNRNLEEDKAKPIKEVYDILNSISEEDAVLMGFENGSHPIRMILRALPVIPPVARQPSIRDGHAYANPLSGLYIDIIKQNNILKDPNVKEDIRAKARSKLFFYIEHLIDNTDGKYAPQKNKLFDSIKELIQGKEALIRGLLMGKRVDYSARTVAGPDPTLKFGQVRVPRVMAQVLTQPVIVNPINQEAMQKLLNPANPKEPSHITHITPGTGPLKGIRMMVNDRVRNNWRLNIGDRVERWLQNGDYLNVNRQPTLHKQSMMGYEVILGDQLTIGLGLWYTTPLNADFDGDELNLHAPQAPDARAEVANLTNVKECIMNPQTNRPIMGAVYDTLTGTYLLTQSDTMVDQDDLPSLMMLIESTDQLSSLSARLALHDINPLSGRALFSALLPADFTYDKSDVSIRDGILINGVITKDHIGTSHNSIIQVLWKDYGRNRTVEFLSDLPHVIDQWLTGYGFSVGLKDCLPRDDRHEKMIKEEIAKAKLQIQALGKPPEDPLERERYERKVAAIVRSVKDIGARIIKEQLDPRNALRVMALSKAKGSEFNIAQIMGLLGQQFLKGERLKPGITQKRRCLPYFDPDDDYDIEARGFCVHGFVQGLSPAELFFHQAGGREGLMDTAIKTSETGHMHHKVVKALEDIIVAYDGSVRSPTGTIFQYVYGEDGFDPAELQKVKTKTGDVPSFIDLKNVATRINSRYGY